MPEPLNAAVVREAPADLDRLAMVLTRADGTTRRWADDEPDVERIPTDLSLSSSVPGGDADLSCGLLREFAFRDPDLRNLNRVMVHGPGVQRVWRGYLSKTPQTKTRVSPAAIGDVGRLKGDPSLRMIPVDRDLSHWGPAPNPRKTYALSVNRPIKHSPQVTQDQANGSALRLAISDSWGMTYLPMCEAWYDAGVGMKVSRVWCRGFGDSNTTFELYFRFCSDEEGKANVTNSGEVYVNAASTVYDFNYTLYSGGAPQRFAYIVWLYPNMGGTAGLEFPFSAQQLAAYGTDVPQTNNPAGGPPGVLGADVLRAILAKSGNGIVYDEANSVADPFVIPHLAWLDAVTPEQAILDTNRFFRNLWGVYDGKLKWAPVKSFGQRWHVRRDEGADPQGAGSDTEKEINGVIVRYEDAKVGAPMVLGPPASGLVGPSGASTAGLVNANPNLPVNEWGERRWFVIQAGLTSEAGALRLGELFREGTEALTSSGSIEIGAFQVYDDTGARYPAWAPSAGDRLVEDDVPGQPERLIVQASYRHSDRKANLSLDAPSNGLEALQERLQVVLVGVVD